MKQSRGIETVTLELLRQGPSAGQLLSASTPYLAVCNNSPAEAVLLPLDQRDFQRRLAGLRYAAGTPGQSADAARAAALEEMARDMTRILDQVRALPGAIRGASADVIHLRLVLSATELAMLPFELANAPRGLPGEGLPLCLTQGTRPVIVTRETRRLRSRPRTWPRDPKILFAHVSYAEVPASVVQAHLLALARALQPWTGWAPDDHAADELSRYLTVLPAASVRALAEACAKTEYTHVHVLAHGTEDVEPHTGERRHALALHRDGSQEDVVPVSGAVLASALCAGGKVPTVVTLASCDAGSVGSLLVENGSVAHALHESGVSLVLASQLPLSMKGSVVMADVLYRELLSGADPRRASHAARQALFREQRHHHDWASLAVYANLPEEPERVFSRVRLAHHKIRVDSGLARLNRRGQPDGPALDDLRRAEAELDVLDDGDPELTQEVDSYLASAAVRWCDPDWPHPRAPARAISRGACDDPVDRPPDPILDRRAWRCPPERGAYGKGRFPSLADSDERSALERAVDHYRRVFGRDPTRLWAGVSALALDWYVARLRDPEREVHLGPAGVTEWNGLWWLCDQQIGAGALARVPEADALAARVELCVLRELVPPDARSSKHAQPGTAAGAFDADVRRLIDLAGPAAYEGFALRRQMLRYERWWARPDVRVAAWSKVMDVEVPAEEAAIEDPLTRLRVLARRVRAELDLRGVPVGWDVR